MTERGVAPVVGLDLGGTNMQIGVVDESAGVVAAHRCKTNAHLGVDSVIDAMTGGIEAACLAADLAVADVAAVGIAAPGAVDIPRGVVLEAPNLGWTDLPLRDIIARRLDRPVVVDNDVNAAAWGEYRLGAGRGAHSVLGVWVGTGVGGGLVLDGRLHHGPLFTAGEIGQSVIMPDAASPYRTLEDLCGRRGMQQIIADRLPDHPGSRLEGDGPVGTRLLTEAFATGDELAVDVVHRAADLLGLAAANLVTVLAIDRVLLGGGITESLGDPFVDRVGASFRRNVFPASHGVACEVRMTELRNNAGLLGAAMLARERD